MFGRARPADAGDMNHYILNELRDLRRGMEGRDGELRGEIAAVRDAVATLSESVSRSHNNAEALRTDVDTIRKDLRSVQKEVDTLSRTGTIDKVQSQSRWDGPKQVLAAIGAVGGGSLALVGVWKFLGLLGLVAAI